MDDYEQKFQNAIKKFKDLGYELIKQTETTYMFTKEFKGKNEPCYYQITVFNPGGDNMRRNIF